MSEAGSRSKGGSGRTLTAAISSNKEAARVCSPRYADSIGYFRFRRDTSCNTVSSFFIAAAIFFRVSSSNAIKNHCTSCGTVTSCFTSRAKNRLRISGNSGIKKVVTVSEKYGKFKIRNLGSDRTFNPYASSSFAIPKNDWVKCKDSCKCVAFPYTLLSTKIAAGKIRIVSKVVCAN